MTGSENAKIVETWWDSSHLRGPFTPGNTSGNNDGRVRDAAGRVVADCGGVEAMADVVAALLNMEWERRAAVPSREGAR